MKIAIAGAGMTGAYLYRILAARGHEVDIFDKGSATKCGISPCAWGTSRGFDELVLAAGLEPSDYVLVRSREILMDGFRVRADLWTFEKQRLVNDLLQGADLRSSQLDAAKYDRVIDATGVSRAFLPPINDDIILPCIQYRIRTPASLDNEIKLGGIGYAWRFPLSATEYHVGCGSLNQDHQKVIAELGWKDGRGSTKDFVCACKGSIRLTTPQCSLPFVTRSGGTEIWGVGEAIGCVAPLAGDGVVPGMRSVQLLLRWWDDPPGYTKAICNEFAWMASERRVIDKLRNKQALGLKDAWVLKKNSTRMGMEIGIREATQLLHHLR